MNLQIPKGGENRRRAKGVSKVNTSVAESSPTVLLSVRTCDTKQTGVR